MKMNAEVGVAFDAGFIQFSGGFQNQLGGAIFGLMVL